MRIFLTLVNTLLLICAAAGEGQMAAAASCWSKKSTPFRPHSVSIAEFGAVGDGLTLNTKAFQNAIFYLRSFADKGGAQLFVPSGLWLTGSFSLISHLTLSLDEDAVILGSTDPADWPVVDPLLPSQRHQSLIFGSNLTDVVITGGNGTVDGQGGAWWDRARNQTLTFMRPNLVEVIKSTDVVISDLTFRNSPYRAIHPVDCRGVFVKNVTILAPSDSPDTGGIYPEASIDVCMEDCYISTGDDLIVIKSGWDEKPSSNITLHRISGSGGGISISGDISGDISIVRLYSLRLSSAITAISINSAGGAAISEVLISGVVLSDVETAFIIVSGAGEISPATIRRITIRDVVGEKIRRAGIVEGIEGDVCFLDVDLRGAAAAVAVPPWNCSRSEGYSDRVSPEICPPLRKPYPGNLSEVCYWMYPLQGMRREIDGVREI